METNIKISLFITLCLCSKIFVVSQIATQKYWRREFSLDDKKMDNFDLLGIKVNSRSHCAMYCLTLPVCKSMTFTGEGDCYGHSDLGQTSASTTSSQGAVTFIMPGRLYQIFSYHIKSKHNSS